ncbi:MAG: hypothetical protein OEZ06_32370 [Myxococcales bacterium]|nr:hypothetical protein [Myxococcales bacterium]
MTAPASNRVRVDTEPSSRRGAKDWGLLAAASLLVLSAHAAVVTDGFRLPLLAPDGPSHYFDAAASALLRGRLDVDPYHIGNEAFILGDRAYGYWGITPALLRVALNTLAPELWGRWSRVVLLLAALLLVVGGHGLVVAMRPSSAAASTAGGRALHGSFLLVLGVGSSALFMPSRPNVYHEANALGVALTVVGYAAFAGYLRRPSSARLLSAMVLCAMSIHARLVVGFGLWIAMAVALASMLMQRAAPGLHGRLSRGRQHLTPPGNISHVVTLAGGLTLAFGSYLAINWLKFGSLLSLPLEQNLQLSAERLARTGGQMIALRNVPANFYNYLAPWNIRFDAASFSLAPVPPGELLTAFGMSYDWREPTISVVAASPALVVLSALGARHVLKGWVRNAPSARWLPLLIGSAATAGVPLAFYSITQRYGHDMLPWLAVTAAIAVSAGDDRPQPQRRAAILGLVLLSFWSAICWWQVGEHYRSWGAELRISPVRADIVLPAYEREARLDPENVTTQSELAHIHHRGGRMERARIHLERALQLDPDHVPSLVLLAVQQRQRNPAGAAQSLAKAVAAQPTTADLRVMFGHTLLELGRRRQALEQLEQALRLAPNHPLALQLLRQAHLGTERQTR